MTPSSGLTILSPTPFFSQLQVISAGLLELHNLLSGYRPVREDGRQLHASAVPQLNPILHGQVDGEHDHAPHLHPQPVVLEAGRIVPVEHLRLDELRS